MTRCCCYLVCMCFFVGYFKLCSLEVIFFHINYQCPESQGLSCRRQQALVEFLTAESSSAESCTTEQSIPKIT